MNVEGSDERPMDEGDGTSVWESEFSEMFCNEFQIHNRHCCNNSQCRKRPMDPQDQLLI